MSELIRREDAIKGLEYKRVIMAEADGFGGGYAYEDGQCDAFTESIEFLKRMPTASPWHRVEDGLPEIGKAVVVSIYGDMWIATRLDDKRFNGRMYWELSDGSWERVENDMYWMPIEPPKEDA